MSRMIDKQPQGEQLFLDHAGYFVADLNAAGDALTRLGFQVSSVNVQHNCLASGELVPTGTSNRLAMLEYGFVEVLAATGATPLAEQMRLGVRRYQGLHLIAFSHPNMPSERERLIANGFAMQPLLALRRRVHTPEGERLTDICVLRTEPGVMTEGRVQLATNHTPELFWTAGSTVHANAVDALTSIFLCVEDPIEAAARYVRFTGRPAREHAGLHIVELDRGSLVLTGPEWANRLFPRFAPPSMPFMAALALRSCDLSRTDMALTAGSVSPVLAKEHLRLVGPAEGLGAYVLFHSPALNSTDVWAHLSEARSRASDN